MSRLKCVHELLFSLNIAVLVLIEHDVTSNPELETRISVWINARLHRPLDSVMGSHPAFLSIALLFAFCLFALLRATSATIVTKVIVRIAAGFLSLILLPTFWLCHHRVPPLPGLPNPPQNLLVLELGVIAACAVVYLLWEQVPNWLSVMIVVTHFVLWGWLFLGFPQFWFAPFMSLFPLVGLSSSLAWVAYISASQQQGNEICQGTKVTN